jgi:DivIVA domain-containing protein
VSLLLVLVLLAVLGGIAVVASGRGTRLEPEAPDRAPYGALEDGDIERADVDRLRFSLAFRGYRMDEVDAVLDRLATELADRDARIAELEERDVADVPEQQPTAGEPPEPEPEQPERHAHHDGRDHP